MFELSLQSIISRYEIYSLDKHLPENEFDKKIRDKQGYVLFDDGVAVGLLRYNLFWDNTPFCTMLFVDWLFWTKKYLERFKNPNLEVYVADHEFSDADVTSYIKLLKQCGIVLYGEEIQEVFADVSDEDFWSAICADIENYDFHDYDARYFASNILILGRILSFKKEKRILSKYEGGIWII